ncbi:MAG: hypothetical protein VX730_02775 [Pseudomonadota bacterium]|nr:hypothetical protein [Pseudomonadota bacterium]
MRYSALLILVLPVCLFLLAFIGGLADSEALFYIMIMLTYTFIGPIAIGVSIITAIVYGHKKHPGLYVVMLGSTSLAALYLGGMGFFMF